MKKAKVKLDLEEDTAEIMGVKVALNQTSSGHYCVPIDRNDNIDIESVCAVKLELIKEGERKKVMLKLHRQFAHPPAKKLAALLKDAGVWKDEYSATLDEINDKCLVCKVYSKTPPRPSVALPMAKQFNEKVCMDLKKWGGKWILHMIDMWSRFSVSVFIERKRPKDVIEKILMCWVGAGFGIMGSIFNDNGGEFSSDEMREVASIL